MKVIKFYYLVNKKYPMSDPLKLKNKLILEQKMKQFKQTNHKSMNSLRSRPKSAQIAQQLYTNSSVKKKVNKRTVSASKQPGQHLMQTPEKKMSPFKNPVLQSTKTKQKTNSSSGSLKKSSKSSNKSNTNSTIKNNLQENTAYLSQLVTKSSELIFEQKQLQQRIRYYKQQIAGQNRKAKQSLIQSKKYEQQKQQIQARTRIKAKQSKIIHEKVMKQREEIMLIKQSIDNLTQKLRTLSQNIKIMTKNNKNTSKQNQQCYNQIRKTDQQAGEIKNVLRELQRRLNMETVQRQELVNQKASILMNAHQIMSSVGKRI